MNDQPQLAGMPQRLSSATPTRLLTWLDCRRRYRFTYLDRPSPAKGPPWAHNSLGGAVHNALAEWWRRPRELRTGPAAGDLVDRFWSADGFRDAGQSETWRQRTRDMVRRYVSGLDPDDEPRGVERTVGVIHAGAALSGRVDRIDQRGGDLVVVDYKTGRHLLTTDDARTSLALAVYAAAAERTLRRPCRRVELHHLPSGDVITWDHDESSLHRQLDRAADLAGECAQAGDRFRSGRAEPGDFPANPSPLCAWCDFRQHCPEGRAITSARSSWAGLAED